MAVVEQNESMRNTANRLFIFSIVCIYVLPLASTRRCPHRIHHTNASRYYIHTACISIKNQLDLERFCSIVPRMFLNTKE